PSLAALVRDDKQSLNFGLFCIQIVCPTSCKIECLALGTGAPGARGLIMATVEAPPQISTQHIAPFKNEPMVDFSRPENAQKMKAALEEVRAELGREYELVIGGKRIKTADKIKSLNPANPSQVVGVF